MLRHYFKTAIRHLINYKLYTLLNLSGLALGVACLILALCYWLDERSYDTFHEDHKNLYRITTNLIQHEGGPRLTTGGTGQVQGPAFQEAIPEVQDYVRLLGGDIYGDVRHEQEVFNLQMLFADDNFLEFFTFPVVHGNPSTALDEINAVVLSERAAKRFFNTTDAVGKLLHLDADPSAKRLGDKPLLVSAVVKDPPANSSIQFDLVLPFRFLQLSFDDKNWLNAYLGTFVRLDERIDREATVRKFEQIYAANAVGQLAAAGFDPKISYGLQPVSDMHLNMLLGGSTWHEGGTVGESKAIYSNLFLGIAFFIFLLAGINFVNINIAGSLNRAKEISIRKITGGSRRSLVLQFMGEAALMSVLSLVVALLLAMLLLPAFNALADKQITAHHFFNGTFGFGLLGVFIAATLLSGLYPALVLSDFRPVEVLYNRNRSIGRFRLGRVLVILQFSLAFVLAFATIVFYAQMKFIHHKALGYEPGPVIRTDISGSRDYEAIRQFLKNETARNDYFEGISFGGDFGLQVAETSIEDRKIPAVHRSTDTAFLRVMGIPLRFGQNLTGQDEAEVLVNEAFVRQAGLKDPIGTAVRLHPDFADREAPFRIVGVVADYHFESLHKPIQPIALYHLPRNSGGIWLKVRKGKMQEGLGTFEQLYRKAMPDASYAFHFMTDLNAREYDREQRWQKMIGLAAVLALIICGLGLFGMTHLNTAQRTREIGIRKILGATTVGLVRLLSKSFLKLVLVAMILASPLAYYLMQTWLKGFAYRVDLSWWIFVLAGILALGVAFLTVGAQALRAASVNPIDNLAKE